MRSIKTPFSIALLGLALAFAGTAVAAAPTNYYGGPVYFGKPSLGVTAAVVKAGGGAKDFSFPEAMQSTLGKVAVQAEINNLAAIYGKKAVNTSMTIMTYAVKDALKRAKQAGVKMPKPPDLSGQALVKKLAELGVTKDGTFWAGYMFDRTITHDLHQQVALDMNAHFGSKAVGTAYKVMNQAMYDIAQQLGMKKVKLASYH